MTTASTGFATNPQLSATLRGVWVLVAGLTVLLYIAGLPLEFERLVEIGTAEYGPAFEQTGISPQMFAIYRTALDILRIILFAAVSAVIVARTRADWLAQLVALLLLTLISASTFPFYTLGFERGWAWRLPVVLLTVGNWVLLMFVMFLFPDGTFRPSWTQPLSMPLAVGIAVLSYLVVWEIENPIIPDTLIFWILALILVPAQVYRYRTTTSPTQRQQTKWVFYGMILTVFWGASTSAFDWLLSSNLPPDTLFRLVYEALVRLVVWFVPLVIFPLCVTVAVTQQRLWDIDLVINRSLVGASITIALGLVFFILFTILQFSLRAILGSDLSWVAAGLSAITIALIFNPVHDGIRGLIDHQIYHFEYDLNEVRQSQKLPNIANPGALTGTRIGNYEMTSVIGRGGMGEVYLGVGGDQQHTAAIKTLRAKDTDLSNSELVKRFEREARALQGLNHPNIVSLYDYGHQDDLHYIAMEYIDGLDLHDHLRAVHQMPLHEVYPIALELAEALDYAHNQGYIHRDIKPGNIMLRAGDNTPVLMDFGIVKITSTVTQITDGRGIGTIEYMAPEQLLSTIEITPRTDLYAFAGVLYRMLTGRRVFQGGSAQVMFAHLQQPPPDPRQFNPDIPEHAAKILVQGLAKKADDRPATAHDIATGLAP